MVWAITAGEMRIAFLLFLLAGLSDLVDGYLAKRFNMATELGAYLDPLADKALIVSIYVTLGIAGAIPPWLVILVVSRDIMIVSAVILSWVMDKPVPLKPGPNTSSTEPAATTCPFSSTMTRDASRATSSVACDT